MQIDSEINPVSINFENSVNNFEARFKYEKRRDKCESEEDDHLQNIFNDEIKVKHFPNFSIEFSLPFSGHLKDGKFIKLSNRINCEQKSPKFCDCDENIMKNTTS